jgi:basic membrane protein A
MRKLVLLLAVLLIVHALLTALGGDAFAQKSKPKVGLVTTEGGKINDGTFNELAYKGMRRALDEFELQGSFIETESAKDYEKNIARFVEQKYDLIISVGFLLRHATATMAARHPQVKFAIVDNAYHPPISNVMGLIFSEDQAGFLAGILAGQLTKSKVVGIVCGREIPPVVR